MSEKAATAKRLLNRYTELEQQQDAISMYGIRHNLLTTEEIKELDRLEIEFTCHRIEVETFIADVKATRNPIRFVKRYIFNNH